MKLFFWRRLNICIVFSCLANKYVSLYPLLIYCAKHNESGITKKGKEPVSLLSFPLLLFVRVYIVNSKNIHFFSSFYLFLSLFWTLPQSLFVCWCVIFILFCLISFALVLSSFELDKLNCLHSTRLNFCFLFSLSFLNNNNTTQYV